MAANKAVKILLIDVSLWSSRGSRAASIAADGLVLHLCGPHGNAPGMDEPPVILLQLFWNTL